jgi:hypothetical protein
MIDSVRHLVLIGTLVIILQSACTGAPPPLIPTSTPLPRPTRVQVASGQTVSLPLEPRAGPTEVMPFLSLHAFIIDEWRKIPMRARRVTLNGTEIARDVTEITLQMPGDTRDTPLMLQVEAEGYEVWALVFRHKINYSRNWDWDIVLRPKGSSQ